LQPKNNKVNGEEIFLSNGMKRSVRLMGTFHISFFLPITMLSHPQVGLYIMVTRNVMLDVKDCSELIHDIKTTSKC